MSAPELTEAEQATIARFGIFEAEERVEQVARAMHRAVCDCDQGATDIDRMMAAAGIAALPASPAEQAVRRVERLAERFDDEARDALRDSEMFYDQQNWAAAKRCGSEARQAASHATDLRAALAPQAGGQP